MHPEPNLFLKFNKEQKMAPRGVENKLGVAQTKARAQALNCTREWRTLEICTITRAISRTLPTQAFSLVLLIDNQPESPYTRVVRGYKRPREKLR